jgi:glyoxylase-like metal-dependent hydrolase (beta-lactamase superfamily II)
MTLGVTSEEITPPDRVEDLVGVGVLQHVAGCAGHQHLPDRVLIVDAGQGDDADLGEGRLQQARRLDAVHLWHTNVHQDHIGLGGADETHRVGAVPHRPHDQELLGPQEGRKGLSEPRIVIDNDDPDLGTGGRSNGEGVQRHLHEVSAGEGPPAIPHLPGSPEGTGDPLS